MKNRIIFILLTIILVVSIWLRFDGVFTGTFAFTYDVGRDMLALQQIEQTHKIPLIGFTTGAQGIFYGPWWYYIIFPAFVLSGGNPQGVAGFVALLGVLAVSIGFLIGKKIENAYLGLFFAGVLAVATTVISTSNQIWNPNMAPIILMLIIYLLVLIRNKPKHLSLLIFFYGLLSALMLDAEIIYGSLTFIATIIFILIFLRDKFTIKTTGLFLLGVLIVLSPRILFEFRHQFLMTDNILHYLHSNTSAPHGTDYFSLLINRVQVFFKLWIDTIAGGNVSIGVVFSIVWLWGMVTLFRKKTNQMRYIAWYCIISIGTFIIGLTLLHNSLFGYYFVGMPLVYVCLFSIGIWNAVYLLPKYFNIVIPCLIVIYLFNPIQRIQQWHQPPWVGDASVYRNQLKVIDYTYKQANKKPFKYVVYTPPVHDYPYQYLYSWYGPMKYHYAPSIQANLAFFILEPDLQYPSREKTWLQQRSKDGVIKKSIVLPSGITIQTREPK